MILLLSFKEMVSLFSRLENAVYHIIRRRARENCKMFLFYLLYFLCDPCFTFYIPQFVFTESKKLNFVLQFIVFSYIVQSMI